MKISRRNFIKIEKNTLGPMIPHNKIEIKLMDPQPKRRHPTHDRLVEAAISLMSEHLPENISVDMILRQSGVSKGSMYHHFENLADLLETALIHNFASTVDSNIALMRNLLDNARTGSEFYHYINQFNALTQSQARVDTRFDRIRLISLVHKNARLAQRLAGEQARLTNGYAELFRIAQSKGWMDTDFDPGAASVLIQAYTLGKVVDDVVDTPMDPDAWHNLIMKIVVRVFGVTPPPEK